MGTTPHRKTRCIGIGLAVIVLFFAAGIALAHQSPTGCNSNRLSVDLSRNVSLIINGDTVYYKVDIANPGTTSTGACDVSDLDVVFHCPAADGTATGASATLTTTGDYPADNSGDNCYSSGLGPDAADTCLHNAGLACVVNLTAGAGTAVAQVLAGGTLRSNGALHDIGAEGCTPGPGCDDPLSVAKEITVEVVACLVNADCNDTLFCTDDACVDFVCQHTAHSCPADSDLCTTESCDETANACVSSAPPSCDDGLFCTDDSCVPATGLCQHTAHSCPADSDLCTTESCDENANACVSSAPPSCDDSDVCTDDSCVPATGLCQHTFDPTNDPSCSPNEICRTKGFWGTHADADPDLKCSQDITGTVLASVGSISICGETLCNTLVDDASSAVEALCVRVQGQQTRILTAQLTAARLNCIISGETGGPCDGISINAVFDACNTACAAGDVEVTIGADTVNCIDALDCFNNGGQFDNATGICTTGTCFVGGADCSEDNPCATGECVPLPGNCHDAPFPDDFVLPNDSLPSSDVCFEKQGPAGSNDECKDANKTLCTVIQPNEDECKTADACI